MVPQSSANFFLFFVDMQDSVEEVLLLLHKLLGELHFPLLEIIWTKKTQNICKKCWNKKSWEGQKRNSRVEEEEPFLEKVVQNQ